MKKKSVVSMVVALSLTATVMVGATLAYLTDKTETLTNTFTIGKVSIDLEELSWDPDKADKLVPGTDIPKDPKVTNTGRNAAWVAVTVDGMNGNTADETGMADFGFSAEVNEGWVLVDKDGKIDTTWDGKTLVDGTYAYTELLAVDATTKNPVFSKVIFADSDAYDKSYVIKGVKGDAVDSDGKKEVEYYIVRDHAGNFLDKDGKVAATEADIAQYTTKEAAEAFVATLEEKISYEFDLNVTAYAIQDMIIDGEDDPDAVYADSKDESGNVTAYGWVKAIFNPVN